MLKLMTVLPTKLYLSLNEIKEGWDKGDKFIRSTTLQDVSKKETNSSTIVFCKVGNKTLRLQ